MADQKRNNAIAENNEDRASKREGYTTHTVEDICKIELDEVAKRKIGGIRAIIKNPLQNERLANYWMDQWANTLRCI